MQFLATEPPSEESADRKGLKVKKPPQVVANSATAAPAAAALTSAKTSTAPKGNAPKPKIPVFEDGGDENGSPLTPATGEWDHGLPSQESKTKENTQAPSTWNGALPSKLGPVTARSKVPIFLDEEPEEEAKPAPAPPKK